MPTLDEVINTIPGLHYAVPPDGPARAAVMGVRSTGHGSPRRWENGREVSGWRGLLALLTGSPVQYGPLVRALAGGGAAGIVCAAPVPAGLVSAGRAHHLPVVEVTAEAASAEYLAEAVFSLRDAEETAHANSLQKQLDSARGLLTSAGKQDAVQAIRQWLEGAVGGEVMLVAPHQVGPPMLPSGQIVPREEIAALAESGQIAAKEVTVEDGLSVRLSSLSTGMPHHVLAVAREGGWPKTAADAIALASPVLASWLRQAAVGDAERVPARTAVLQMLLDEQVQPAREAAKAIRVAHAVLHTAARVRVCVISSPSQDMVVSALHHHLGDKALVVPYGETIVAVIVDDEKVLAALRRYLHPRRAYIGVSGRHALDEVRVGHLHARQAMGAATDRPERWARYVPVLSDLASALPIGPAYRWQQDLLQPLEGLRPATRDLWLETTRLVMTHGTSVAAATMGVHYNSVRRRTAQISGALGLDPGDPGDSIVLDLALRIRRLRLRAPARSTPITLGELLETPAASAWARTMIGTLPPHLLEIVIVWLDAWADGADGANARAAERLGTMPKTLRRRLHEAEALLGRTLVTSAPLAGPDPTPGRVGSRPPQPPSTLPAERGINDLFLAATITGTLQRPVLTPRHTQR